MSGSYELSFMLFISLFFSEYRDTLGQRIIAIPVLVGDYDNYICIRSTLLTLGAHAHSKGYCSCRVCMCVYVCVCVCVCVCMCVCMCDHSYLPPHTLESQNRDTNVFTAIQRLF